MQIFAWSLALGFLRMFTSAMMSNQLVFEADQGENFVIASSRQTTPILISSSASEAVSIALHTFADDVERVVGQRPEIYVDVLPSHVTNAITVEVLSDDRLHLGDSESQKHFRATNRHSLTGQWESFRIEVPKRSYESGLKTLEIIGSDNRGAIFALYTLSEHMGVSPWYWWADVPVKRRDTVAFPPNAVYQHGPPAVKYRGLFLNDEQPVLWNWARDHFKMGEKPPFQVGMYERVFELILRLKGNYAWPAMWASMFAADGLDQPEGKLPKSPTPGPNQALAAKMGIVMGTSHHEPMSRNQKEWNTWSQGPWNFQDNPEELTDFWRYGAERAKGLETVFTVGMRGDGDLPLDGANLELLENITSVQQKLLRDTYGEIDKIPQMWAMYKEVMGYYANGLKVPQEVTALLADDNWGNLQAVLPKERRKPGAGGIYYHADYVGDPRSYKWINTVPLAKSKSAANQSANIVVWEQLNVALAFQVDEIWILNVGDLKFLEVPLEYFMSIAYNGQTLGRNSVLNHLQRIAERDFGMEQGQEIAEIMALYSIYASRRKAELLDSLTYSLVNYNEADRILKDWQSLEQRALKVLDKLDTSKTAFYEVVLVQIQLQTNLHRLYNSAAKSNLYATQGRTASNLFAADARACFEQDHQLTVEFNKIEDGKWNHMLCQTHIGYQYWQMPVRNTMPPVSYISSDQASWGVGNLVNIRYTVENSLGAWPGDNQHNCPLGYACPDPTLLPMDPFGQPRWVEVAAGGPEDVNFTVTAAQDWVIVNPSKGTIKSDGSTDTRVWISIDWTKATGNETTVTFTSSDKAAPMVVTIPLIHESPASDFHGAVQGDGYVAIEAAHFQASNITNDNSTEFAWKEIPFYGRTQSAVAMFPNSDTKFAPGLGPSIRYDFWSTAAKEVEIIFHIGPTLNYMLGSKLAFAVQMDKQDIVEIEPIPDAPLGSLPEDWETIVANEIREVKLKMTLGSGGAHSLTIYGVTSGIVIERVLVDLGGIAARGNSYLGPPESVIV